METLNAWWDAFAQSLGASLAEVGAYIPALATAIAVMLFGWLVAKLVRGLLERSTIALSHLCERIGQPLTVTGLRISRRLVALTANFAFWVIVLLFAAVAARVAGLEAFSVWLDRIVDYLPTLAAGLLIAFAGYLLSTLVRDIVAAALASVGSKESEAASWAAQASVFAAALVIGLDQIGIDVTFLIILAAVFVGGVLLSIALAFGLGARDFVGNLIAAHQLRGTLEAGDLARVGDAEGRVVEITQTMVVLLTEHGRTLVPASHLQKHASTVLLEKSDE